MSKIPYDVLFQSGADPKEAYEALLPKFMELKLEGRPSKIRFRDREVWFEQVNLSAWESVMAELAEAAGMQSRRFAITAG